MLDPGHGGHDPGAVANGLKEKDLVLKIVKKTKAILEKVYGATVKLTRSTDVYIDLSQRARLANNWGADYFVSIHINAGGGTGFETRFVLINYLQHLALESSKRLCMM